MIRGKTMKEKSHTHPRWEDNLKDQSTEEMHGRYHLVECVISAHDWGIWDLVLSVPGWYDDDDDEVRHVPGASLCTLVFKVECCHSASGYRSITSPRFEKCLFYPRLDAATQPVSTETVKDTKIFEDNWYWLRCSSASQPMSIETC